MRTSKSTLTVARMALRAARDALVDFSHPKSPRKSTQPQLVACLIVKEFLGLDYRGILTWTPRAYPTATQPGASPTSTPCGTRS